MVRDFKESDTGKRVLTADGDELGVVEQVERGNVHIRPDAGIQESMRRKLGWTDDDETTFELKKSAVSQIASDGIYLKKTL